MNTQLQEVSHKDFFLFVLGGNREKNGKKEVGEWKKERNGGNGRFLI